MANLHFYEKFGREVTNAFGYDFPEEADSFAVEQLKQLVRLAAGDCSSWPQSSRQSPFPALD
jgi:hypothetical protein